MSDQKQDNGEREEKIWPGLPSVSRAIGYLSFVIAGVLASTKTGFVYFAGLCLLGHMLVCFSEAADVVSKAEKKAEAFGLVCSGSTSRFCELPSDSKRTQADSWPRSGFGPLERIQ